MIGCDNVDCTIEWFHMGCLKMTNAPQGSGTAKNVQDQENKKSLTIIDIICMLLYHVHCHCN